jgi:catechol 2,3-dioxygenase-like lactoylglutathione lyase family enzyme
MTLQTAVPVLRAAEYPRAKAFYTEMLGFAVVEEGGDPVQFGIFRQRTAQLFVDCWTGADTPPAPGWRAYFHTDDVDALAADLIAKGATLKGPETQPYGMREIEMSDPDGNVLCFGQDMP